MKNLELIHLTNMEANSLVPKLRFSEFGDKFNKRVLGDLTNNISSGKSKCEESGGFDVYGSTGIIGVSLNYSHKGKYLLVARVGANAGFINYVDGCFGVTDNTLVVDLKDGVNINFILNYLLSYNLNRLVFGSGQPLITGGILKKVKLNIPLISEQNKIASFLTSVDKKINLLTKKKALLESYKKGVMQKIFSQEIRFKDEDGKDFPDWEEKRIREVFEERNEKNFIDMELLSISINKGIFKQSESNKKDNSNSDKSNYKRVLIGDIAYNSMRMWQGASAVSILNGIISPAYTVLKSNDFNCSQYFGYLFKMSFMIQTFQKHSQGLTSDTWNLKYRMISPIKINIPLLEEQNKIASFLSSIDKKIELVDFQLERNKEFKKGLLQQMFV